MNRSFIKTLCSALILSIFSTPLFSFHFVADPRYATNPCVMLQNRTETKLIVFCSDAIVKRDEYGRLMPCPCKALCSSYIIHAVEFARNKPINAMLFNYLRENNDQLEQVEYLMQNCKTNAGNTPPRNFYRPPVIDYSKIECEGFLAQTSVKINIGEQKPLEFIQPGDTVWSFDLEEKKMERNLRYKSLQGTTILLFS